MDPTAQGYITDVAYTDNYYEQLSPVTLNYLAALNGVVPRDLTDFDYCELGCGPGMSLLTHAAALPGGRFVGIDLNTDHIRQARDAAGDGGITNLSLIAEPVSDELAASGLASFDFIVMHGLYSWVPEEVRHTVLRFIDARLKPGGLVLVSYNALPGSAGHRALREAMRRFAEPLSDNSIERAQLGLSYLRLMLNAQAPIFRLNPELAKYAEQLFAKDLRYIAHEFFNESWNPLDVDRVAAEMGSAGLEFAGCLPLWQNHPEADVPPNLASFFASQSDRLAREAHKDFIYNTVFRTDLYVRPSADGSHRTERSVALWNMPFGSVVPPESVRLSMHSGALELPLNTRDSRVIFDLVKDAPRTPAQLAAAPALAGVSPEKLIDLLCIWVLSGQVRPALMHPDSKPARAQQSANAAHAVRTLRQAESGKVWLCSPRFGCAFPFDPLPALALCALTADSMPAEAALCDLIERCSLIVEEDGAPMAKSTLDSLAHQLYTELEANGTLRQARRLGVI